MAELSFPEEEIGYFVSNGVLENCVQITTIEMRLVMRNTAFCICEKQRRRSASQ